MKWVLALVCVLVAAVALQFRGDFEGHVDYRAPDLRKALAVNPPGWAAEDLPLGNTESVLAATEKTLRYDDYVFRRYVRGSVEFTVYVAYWSPGKHPPQMVAQHTPDMCWTMNGMTCPEMRFNVSQSIGQAELWPGQWRKFVAPNGQPTYTMFWHLVGERPFDYGDQFYSMPHPVTFWLESVKFAVGAKRPQLFFRITSNVPPEQIWNDSGVQEALGGFVTLGLARPRA
jgi:hypothetical protein